MTIVHIIPIDTHTSPHHPHIHAQIFHLMSRDVRTMPCSSYLYHHYNALYKYMCVIHLVVINGIYGSVCKAMHSCYTCTYTNTHTHTCTHCTHLHNQWKWENVGRGSVKIYMTDKVTSKVMIVWFITTCTLEHVVYVLSDRYCLFTYTTGITSLTDWDYITYRSSNVNNRMKHIDEKQT